VAASEVHRRPLGRSPTALRTWSRKSLVTVDLGRRPSCATGWLETTRGLCRSRKLTEKAASSSASRGDIPNTAGITSKATKLSWGIGVADRMVLAGP